MKMRIALCFTTLLLFQFSNAQQTFYDVTAGNGNGLRFWNGNNNYKIHMGNAAENHYGPVTDYSIKTNMAGPVGRGWTWGEPGKTPIAALNLSGSFQLAGSFNVTSANYVDISVKRTNGSSTSIGLTSGTHEGFLASSGQIKFLTGGTTEPRMWINEVGNVGIGTTTPTNLQGFQKVLNLEGDGNSKIVASSNTDYRVGLYSHSGWAGEGGGVVGTESNHDLHFITNYNTKMSVLKSGEVGIGTMNPESHLHIVKPAESGSEKVFRLAVEDAGSDYFRISNGTGVEGQFIPSMAAYHVTDNRTAFFLSAVIDQNNDAGEDPIMVFDSRIDGSPAVNRPLFAWKSSGQDRMIMAADGSLGIGTTPGNAKLAVEGKIASSEVVVEISPGQGPDYVFENDYELRSLAETKMFIQENKHLPEIPPAREMEKNGIGVADMNMRLLKKIEELTLYQIELLEKVEALQEKVEKLESGN